MKGIILAGGTGSRLYPLTKVTNKHLLPVGKYPMIFHAVNKLKQAQIQDILIVTGKEHMGEVVNLLGSGREMGVAFTYKVQDEAGGIAQALDLAEDFVGNDQMVVILGDNVFEDDISSYVNNFRKQINGAKILLQEVHDPQRYGVAELLGEKIISIEEKPKDPKSNFAVTGIYMFDSSVFEIIKTLVPSGRGELEITDVNNAYIAKNELTFDILKGWWTDAGTHASLARANELAREINFSEEFGKIKVIRGWNSMLVKPTPLDGAFIIEPTVYGDHRGFFMETYNEEILHKQGIDYRFIQDNHSLSVEAGVIRGLHYQLNPKAQAKLVRVVSGAIYDVIVDIRKNSPTFGKWIGVILSESNYRQLLVPVGFAHGFCTLVPNTEVVYKVNEYYSPENDRGIIWNDTSLAIEWPTSKPILSDKDMKHPVLADIENKLYLLRGNYDYCINSTYDIN